MKFLHTLTACLLLMCAGVAGADMDNGRDALDRHDWHAAYREFLPLAKAGNPEAQYYVGLLYVQGHGVWRNYTKAIEWLQLSAAQDNAHAKEVLGRLYHDGSGVTKDPEQAVRLMQEAASQGLASAQYDIGVLYARGDGLPHDDTQAAKWFEKASAQGLASAQYNLGNLYQSGRGVTQNLTRARTLYLQAAAQGHAAACSNLGILYEEGTGGVARNKIVAYALYDLATTHPSEAVTLARRNRDNLGRTMTHTEIATARTLSSQLARGPFISTLSRFIKEHPVQPTH